MPLPSGDFIMVGNRNSGRRRKCDEFKRVKIMVSVPYSKAQFASAMGYSNSKLFQYALDVVTDLGEDGIYLEEMLKGSEASNKEAVKITVTALKGSNDQIVRRMQDDEREWEQSLNANIEKTLDRLCSKRVRVRMNETPSDKTPVFPIVKEDITGKLTANMISLYMSEEYNELEHKGRRLRKPRTAEEVRTHFEPILRSAEYKDKTPPVQLPVEVRKLLVGI
jgi:hypothetical protein